MQFHNLCPCPGERDCPDGAPGAVGDNETVIRFIPISEQLDAVDQGFTVNCKVFTKDELAYKDKNRKSASLLSDELTARDVVCLRAKDRNREDGWAHDPVLARAKTSALRDLRDDRGRREACVHADPTNDHLGRCATHAYVRHAHRVPDKKDVMNWAVFRAKVATDFSDVRHVSGAALSPPVSSLSGSAPLP